MDDEGLDPVGLQKAFDGLPQVIVSSGNRARGDDERLIDPPGKGARTGMKKDPSREPLFIERFVQTDILGCRVGVEKLFQVVEQGPQEP